MRRTLLLASIASCLVASVSAAGADPSATPAPAAERRDAHAPDALAHLHVRLPKGWTRRWLGDDVPQRWTFSKEDDFYGLLRVEVYRRDFEAATADAWIAAQKSHWDAQTRASATPVSSAEGVAWDLVIRPQVTPDAPNHGYLLLRDVGGQHLVCVCTTLPDADVARTYYPPGRDASRIPAEIAAMHDEVAKICSGLEL